MRSRMVSLAIGVVVVLGVAALAVGWAAWKRPLAVFGWAAQRALARAGFERSVLDTAAGPQTAWRAGEGPRLLLLHGAGDRAATWVKVAPELAARYRVVIPDLAGHGASAPVTGPLPIHRVVEALESLLVLEAADGPVTVAGNSLGGWMALVLAHRHPEMVGRVVVINGGAVRGQRDDLTLTPATREEARTLMAALRDAGRAPIPGFVLDDIIRTARVGPIGRLVAAADSMEVFVLDGRLGEITTPVDLVWGASDRLMPLEYARAMAADLRAARITEIPACGHVPHQECPEALLETLNRILAAPLPGPSEPGSADAPR